MERNSYLFTTCPRYGFLSVVCVRADHVLDSSLDHLLLSSPFKPDISRPRPHALLCLVILVLNLLPTNLTIHSPKRPCQPIISAGQNRTTHVEVCGLFVVGGPERHPRA
ncbi:hypothetical protein EXIGLDRAFT_737394 [Exidia glandulosa HHB12029]|uniref:Uncharacterized protein n=1 Tax=Exidia glandulosa HHB12029 TaxID=1314781 RepID=A0A165IZC3_EXIGL|nr:hypothetical protein EXIGLDRAFT_737394 [Exidia glandulosa HHB12029]